MIRMIVTDVDGTIVGKDEILHQELIDRVHELKKRGIHFSIATGRTAGLAQGYARQLELDIPYAACNGGTIVNSGAVLFKEEISVLTLKPIFEQADQMGMSLLYSIDGVEEAYRLTDYVANQQKVYDRYHHPHLFSETEWNHLQIDKLIVMAAERDGSIGEIEKLCKQLPEAYYYKRYANKAIDILPASATKENGLRKIAESMNLELEEILFIGDDLNDVESIMLAGVGVAVSNAQEPAKLAADYVTTRPCYEGVLEAINRFVPEV